MSQLETKFDTELHRDSHVVVCRFPLPNWQPVHTSGNGIDTVWVYKHPSNTDYTRIAKPLIDSDGNAYNAVDTVTSESYNIQGDQTVSNENQTNIGDQKHTDQDEKR